MSGPTRKLKADGLPLDITKIRLETFFSNENSQGGGPVEDVQISEDRTSAIITFKEVEAVERIIKRKDTVTMSSVFVKVNPHFDEIPNYCDDNLADEMKEIKSKSLDPENSQETNNKTTTTNIAKQKAVFSSKDFKSKTLSSENEIFKDINSKNLSSDNVISKDISAKNVSTENVIFRDLRSEDLRSKDSINKHLSSNDLSSKELSSTHLSSKDLSSKDLSSKNLSSEGCQHQHTITSLDLNASDQNISSERIVADDPLIHKEMTSKDELPVYPNLMYLNGDLGDLEQLAKQITSKTGIEVDEIIQQDVLDSCIVVFKRDSNFDGILMKGNGLTLGSKQLTTEPVFKTNSIVVNGLTEKVTMSLLKTYLENKDLSGGGKIKCMEEFKEDKQAIVYFQRNVEVEDILFKKQEIEIDGAKLFISKYFPSLSKHDFNNEVKSEAKDGFITGKHLTISDTEKVQKLVENESKNTLKKDIPDQSDWTEIWSRIRSRSTNTFRLNIKSFGIYEFLQGADGQKLIDAIQDKHGCSVKVVPNSEKNLSVEGPITEGLHHNNVCKGGPNKNENSWKIGRLKVNLIKGEIEKQTSDIIVITVNRTLDLNVGALAQVILSQAGVKVQNELKQRYANGIKLFDFAETSGGSLQAKHIFHACIPTYSQGADQQMTDLVKNLLARAELLQAKSISFPTIGTGNLKCPLDIFSKVMLQAIIQHSKLKSNSLKQVQLVVFPSHSNAAEAIRAVFSTGVMEASSELKGNVYKYGDVFLKIKHGDITEEDTDVIVTSIKDSMNLASSGGVCSLLLKKCGKKLQDECNAKKKDLDSKDVIVTSAPNLPCKHIIFMNQNTFAPRLAQGIFKVLIEAENLGAMSLSLPAFGAGIHKKRIASIKQCIFQAVEEFGKLPTKNLRKIKLVILNAAILEDFLDHDGSHPHLYNKETTGTTMLPENISQEVNVDFHSLIAQKKTKAAKELLDACNIAYKKEKVIESNLHLLSSIQIKELLDLCSKHLILVKMNVKRGFLELESFGPNGMLEVKKRLKKLIEVASKRSTNIGVEWQYKQDDKNWFGFEPLLNSEMERMYQQKVTTCLLQDANGCVYEIHFPKMIATCSTVYTIRRIDRSQAQQLWPKHWEPMSKTDNLKVVEVKLGSDEYNEVEKHFHMTLPGSPIKKLERIQNKSLYLQFCVKKKELDQYNPQGHENEQKLFHGTMSDCIPPINENGFNRNYCGVNGTVYGSGVYFADKSSYSINYTKSDSDGFRHMYRARVLTGEFIETNSSTKYLPKKPGTNRPYDSGGEKSRGIYVIFHDSQVYPEYLITF